jgi:predicted type IV restriction endonuclease
VRSPQSKISQIVTQTMTTTLYELKERAGLHEELLSLETLTLPELNESDRSTLTQIRQDYHNLTRHGELREDVVKMVILSPLLRLAGFYSGEFQIISEVGVELKFPYEEGSRGRVDLLIVKDAIWILTIESKGEILAARTALPQLLHYMLNGNQAKWGLVTNGYEFVFVRLFTPKLQISYLLDLERPGDLETVAAILKYIVVEENS